LLPAIPILHEQQAALRVSSRFGALRCAGLERWSVLFFDPLRALMTTSTGGVVMRLDTRLHYERLASVPYCADKPPALAGISPKMLTTSRAISFYLTLPVSSRHVPGLRRRGNKKRGGIPAPSRPGHAKSREHCLR